MGLGFVGGCALEKESKDVILSHGEFFALSLWTWHKGEY